MLPFRRSIGCVHGGEVGSPELPCRRCRPDTPDLARRPATTVGRPASGAFGVPGEFSWVRMSGSVVATQLRTRPPMAGELARGAAGLVFAAFLVTHLELILLWLATQFFWLIVIGVVLTMFGMGWLVGVGAGLFGFLLALAARMLPVPRPRDPSPSMRVRVATRSGDREFEVGGHEVGIQVGDWIQASTLPAFRARQALVVRNLSTHTTLRARAAGGVVFPALLVVLLLSVW